MKFRKNFMKTMSRAVKPIVVVRENTDLASKDAEVHMRMSSLARATSLKYSYPGPVSRVVERMDGSLSLSRRFRVVIVLRVQL